MRFFKFVAMLGGANPSYPLEVDNRIRHLVIGGLIIAVATWAFGGATSLFYGTVHLPGPLAVVAGLLVAMFVFGVDSLITCTPGHRSWMLLIRGMMSLAIGLVISHAVLLYIDRDELAAITDAHNQQVVQAITAKVTASSQWPGATAKANSQIEADQKAITADHAAFQDAQTQLGKLKKAWIDDVACTQGNFAANGDLCHQGPNSTALWASYDKYQSVTLPGIEKATNDDIAAKDADIRQLTAEVATDQAKLQDQITEATTAALADTGLVAQSDALWTLLKRDTFAWLYPVFFFIVDIMVALLKAILPETDYDRTRRRSREEDELMYAKARGSRQWEEAGDEAAGHFAAVALERVKAETQRETERIRSHAARAAQPSASAPGKETTTVGRPRTLRRPRLRRWATIGGIAAVCLVLVFPSLGTGQGNASSSNGLSATGGQSISLHGGETLTIPVGSISGNAPVTATYTAAHAWTGNVPASDEVTFSSEGTIVGGPPVLSLPVPAAEITAARDGALQVAFRSSAGGGWTSYPTAYDSVTHTLNASLTHFSTWRFWSSGWSQSLASISQTAGELVGRRAADAPDCGTGPAAPNWYGTSPGIGNNPDLPVRSCVMGHPGDSVLDVELVNNRPYGLMLDYGGAAVEWGKHAAPDTVVASLRDAIGDYAARVSGGLYLPPLSSASIGIVNTGQDRNLTFTITPDRATILADTVEMSMGPLIKKNASAAVLRWARDVFAAAAAGSCAEFMTGFPVTTIPDRSTVMTLLTSAAPECLKDILTLAANSEVAAEAGLDAAAIALIATGVAALEKIIAVGKWADIEDKIGKVLDFALDRAFAALPGLGYGFRVLKDAARAVMLSHRDIHRRLLLT